MTEQIVDAGQVAAPAATEVATPVVKDAAIAPAANEPAATDAGRAATLAEGGGADRPVAVQADWPDDWRVKMAGEDKAYLKKLERFTSPVEFLKSHRALEQRLSSGELKKALPENPTDEERQAWRKENGIPETPDKYDTDIGNGFVWGEADKPLLEDFTKYALANDMTPAEVKKSLGWYGRMQEQAIIQQQDADEQFAVRAEEELRAEWGGEFRRNQTAIGNLLASWPKDVADSLLTARMPDGSIAGNNPGLLRQLARLSREMNPTATLIPAGSADPAKSVQDRLNELTGMMGDRSSAYWKGPTAPQFQQEFRDLTEAAQQMQARGKAA